MKKTRELRKWKILQEKDISPSPWFPLYLHKVEMPNGKIIDDYYLSKHDNVAMIAPITRDGKIVLVRQYKHGVEEVILELPAGRIEKNLSPLEAAFKELKEETGVVADNLIFLGEILTSPTKDSTRVYCYLALDVEITGEQDLDETEEINVEVYPLSDLKSLISSGEFKGSEALATLLKAKIYLESRNLDVQISI
jgi:ADP-ribose pyrophosphatase